MQLRLRFGQMTPLVLFAAITGLAFLAGCGLFQAPKAKIEITPIHVGIVSEDTQPWQKCSVVLNESAGEQAYKFALGNVKPGAHEMVFLTQFSQKDGKRFLPILDKVRDVTLHCQNPAQAVTQTRE